ncbi:MAG: PLP-dependent aminotransferase family protein [Ruminococcaceae bacterium]|nr:PLP-dependent aminotransferase family protein [Oscillospiraceae bacterium]
MNYSVNKSEKTPAYLQLYFQLRDDIVREIYPFGSRLPSKRLVADETGISVITVEHAYALLCDEGYVEARQRSGYFVTFTKEDGFSLPPVKEKEKNISHAQSHSGFFPFSVLAKTMRFVLSEYGEATLDTSPNTGCDELREAIRSYLLRSRGLNCESDQIVIGSGAEYLYALLIELFGRDKKYGLESPSYEKIELVYKNAGASYEMLSLSPDGIDSRALKGTRAQVLHITPYRSFPSGVTASASKRHEYIRWAGENDRFIIEDDFESEFSVLKKTEDTLFSLTDRDNVIYMNTFSRTISPSMRVGYMVLPKRLVGVFEEKLGFYSCSVPTFEQLVIARLISNGDFERHINRVRRLKRKEQREALNAKIKN